MNRDTWNELQFYESTDVLKQLAREHVGFQMNSGQAGEIRACLYHAREYFRSAYAADIAVKPLLLFYGMSNLAKAITMLYGGKERSRLCCLPQSHGLDFPGDFGSSLEEASCTILNAGTFQNFNGAIARGDEVTCDSIRAQVTNASSDSLAGVELNLRKLWARVPELRRLYARTFDSYSMVLEADFSVQLGDRYVLRLHPTMGSSLWYAAPDRDELNALLSDLLIEGHEIDQDPLATTICFPALPASEIRWIEAEETQYTIRGTLASQQHQGPLLAPLSVEFMGMFILGMVVRYRPDLWIQLTRLGHGDRPLALAMAFIDHCEGSFPLRVLSILQNPHHAERLANRI